MKIIQEYKDGDVYRSDVDISKAEWLEILKDKDVSENYKESVACFYYLPDYKGSCVSAGKPFGKKPASLNASIWQFGRYVQNRLNRFELIGTDGKSTFWPVAMGQGKPLKGAEEGSFECFRRFKLAKPCARQVSRLSFCSKMAFQNPIVRTISISSRRGHILRLAPMVGYC